ncbi:aminoacyl-tRNA hydrolase [Lentisalinibacter sediminis]|uniref:aminoacyl-tRNA hydrolase n=1 Tax=Lentisalinibacter sediminis TaxID=2992237 RepID=UPI00386749F8
MDYPPVKAIVGLGNPGDRYADTRHNAGFWFVDELARRHGGSFAYHKRFDAEACRVRVDGGELWLIKPHSYMNRSGGPVRAFMDYYRLKPGEILVAHDELDHPPGNVRLKEGGGHGGHNGLRDVSRHIGPEYPRLRIGVGHPGHRDEVTDYVLRRAPAGEERLIREAVDRAADVMPTLFEKGMQQAMNRLHTKPADESAKKPAAAGKAAGKSGGNGGGKSGGKSAGDERPD